MLELLATAEAILRIDFNRRVGARKRDGLSKRFRAIKKNAINDARARSARRARIRLDDDILEAMTGEGIRVSEFRGALKLRHWLAHGRYWRPNLGRNYTPEEVFEICEACRFDFPIEREETSNSSAAQGNPARTSPATTGLTNGRQKPLARRFPQRRQSALRGRRR
jgi:hypothetical protein